jgi:SAM-dependent methyltransferase
LQILRLDDPSKVKHVLDLGAGTGKMTRLLDKYDHLKITAVEPVKEMREIIPQFCPRVKVLEGVSTEIPLESNSQDAVVIAQAFHWFANEESIKEIHRVLKPGGGLACVWNFEDTNKRKWVGLCRKLLEKYEELSPQYRLKKHEKVWELPSAQLLYDLPVKKIQFEHYTLVSKEDYLERLLSKSYISKRSVDEVEKIRRECIEVLDEADDIQLVFNEKEHVGEPLLLHPYVTDLEYVFKKK